MLALLLVLDMITQWGGAWRDYRDIEFANRFLVGIATVMLVYCFAATQFFPKEGSTANTLDKHFFTHRNLMLGGVVFANVLLTGDSLIRQYLQTGIDGTSWPRISANAFWFAMMLVIWIAKSARIIKVALGANIHFILYWLLRCRELIGEPANREQSSAR